MIDEVGIANSRIWQIEGRGSWVVKEKEISHGVKAQGVSESFYLDDRCGRVNIISTFLFVLAFLQLGKDRK